MATEEWAELGASYYYGADASAGLWGKPSYSSESASSSFGSLKGTTVCSRTHRQLLGKHSATYGSLDIPELRDEVSRPHTDNSNDYYRSRAATSSSYSPFDAVSTSSLADVRDNTSASAFVCPCIARRKAMEAAAKMAADAAAALPDDQSSAVQRAVKQGVRVDVE